MYFEDIGPRIRAARSAKKLTQEALAQKTGVSRTTLNQLESGAGAGIGVKKLMSVLEAVGLELNVSRKPKKSAPDFLKMACLSANVSYKGKLARKELTQVLVTGKIPKDKRPQLRVVFDELPPSIFDGLVQQVAKICGESKLKKNVETVAQAIHSQKRIAA